MNDIKLKKLMNVERSIVNFYGNKTVRTIDSLYNHMIHSGYPDDHFGYSSFQEFLIAFFQDKITIDNQNALLDKQYLTDFQQGKSIVKEIISKIENDIITYLQGKTNVLLSDLESYLRNNGYRYGQIHDFIHTYYKNLVTIETILINNKKEKIIYLNQSVNNLDLEKLITLEKTIVNYYGNKESITLEALEIHLSHCGYPEDHFGFSSMKTFLKYYFKDVITINNNMISFDKKYIENAQDKQPIGLSIIHEIEPIIIDCLNNDCHDVETIEKYIQEKGYHYSNIQNIITNYRYQLTAGEQSLNTIFEINSSYLVNTPLELSINMLEKGINHMREFFYQLEGKDKPSDKIQLNDFDKLLIKTKNTQNLYKYMNQPDIFNQGKNRCLENINGQRFREYFNKLVESHHPNDWHGLLKRLEICHHEYYDYFLALALLSTKKEQYWLEYLDLLQKNNHIQNIMPLLKIAHTLFYTNKEYINTYKAKIMSIFIDNNQYDTLFHDVLPLINKDENSLDYRLLDYTQNDSMIPFEFIQEIYDSELSIRIINKIMNYYWYKNQDNNNYMIKIFSYICNQYPMSYMEDIYNQKLYDFSSKKMYILEKMFNDIIHDFQKEYIAFGLFIIHKCTFLKDDDIQLFMALKSDAANALKQKLIDEYTNIDEINLYELKIFNHDTVGLKDIETTLYCQRIKKEISQYDQNKIIDIINNMFNQGHYYIVNMMYNDYPLSYDKDLMMNICQSMIQSHQFNQAITFINNNLTDDKEQLIIKTLASNFEVNGLNDQAYDIFDSQFTMEQAIKLLINYCRSNANVPFILMAIYHKIDTVRLNYLYLFYQKGNISKYTLLLKMIRKTYYNLKNNVFNIFEDAICQYDVNELKEFFNWCNFIKPIKKDMTNDFHFLSKQFIKLANQFDLIDSWELCINSIFNNSKIKNTSLAYSLKAMYLIKFKDNQDNDYQIITNYYLYAIYDKNHNFIKLNTSLITFMNDTYLTSLLQTLTEKPEAITQASHDDIQSFYDTLTQQYLDNYNTIILQIMNIITLYANDIALYLPIYQSLIKTNQDKSSTIQFLFKLYPSHKYQKEIKMILNDSWTCNNVEQRALDVLRIIYDDNQKEIFGLSEFLSQQFRNDMVHIFNDYPDINPYIIKIKENNDYPLYYQLIIFKETFNIIYNHTLYNAFEIHISDVEKTKNSSEYQKNYMTALDAKLSITYQQCYYNGSFGTFYIIRKYKNILLLKVLQNKDSFDESNAQVIKRMQDNGHYGLAHEEYNKFKNILQSLLNSDIDHELLRLYLICLYDHQFDLLYDYTDLNLPLEIYNNLARIPYNLNLLDIYQKADDKNKALSFIHSFNSKMAEAIASITQVDFNDRDILTIIASNQREFVVVMDDVILDIYKDHIDDMVTLISELRHPSVLLRAIDKNTRKNIPVDNIITQKILSKINKENYYHYYSAIQNAYMQKFDNCIVHYFKIINDKEIMHEFSDEFQLLTDYIKSSGQTQFKYKGKLSNDDEIQEKEIKNIDFLKDPNAKRSSLKEAQEAFKSFYQNTQSDLRLETGSIAINYMKNISDFYRLCGNIKTTYNEFIFEYGLVYASSYNHHLSIDKKLSVLLKLYSYYDNLNDLFKVKIREELDPLFMTIITYSQNKKEFISIQSWIKQFKAIKHNVHRFINNDDYSHSFEIIEEFVKDVPEALVDCYYYYQNFYNSKNFNHSLILQDFEQSLKHDIKVLKKGCLLKIDNIHPNIEDDKIFFEVNNIGGEVIDLLNKDLKIKVTFNFDSNSLLADFNQYQEDSLFHTYKNYNTLLKTGNRIGEYIDIPYKIAQLLKQDDLVQCQISIYILNREICRDIRTYTYTNRISYHYDDCHFNVRDCAWSEGNKGFGREDEINKLQNSMKQSGITMIYGSSRIGKSSLLTYLKEKYSQSYYQQNPIDSLIVISLCDATNLTYYQDLKYESDEEIIQFLFIDSIYKGLSESDRHHIYGKKLDVDVLFEEVEKQKRTVTKIQMISDYLKNNHAVIWILIDEFQQLIDKWQINDDKIDNWKEVNNYLKTISNIKFVLCGSDAIVKAMNNPYDNWHKIIVEYDNQPIMQLNQSGFKEMIQDEQVWKHNHCPFVASAIDYLFNYVSGNATYGKLLANMMIDSEVLHHREHIFSYDVFKATSMMLENQSNDLDHMQSTQTIISQVTKNLEDEERYLLYIAKTLEMNPNRNGVSKEEIYHDFAVTYEHHKEDIDIALDVCMVRGILKIVDDKYYNFTTPFYYYCYSHNAKNIDLDKLRETEVIVEVVDNHYDISVEEAFDVMMDQFDKISDNSQLTYLSSLNAKANKNVKNKLLEDKGNTYNNYGIDARDSTGTVINAQSISNTYNAILTGITGDDLVKAYHAIPQFKHYVTDDTLQRIETLQEDSEEFEELINEPMNQVYEANKQALILTEDNFNVWETLGITKQNYDELTLTVDLQFMTDIYLGAKLEHIYENMNTNDIAKDYSPITIMYCKVIEKMLKYYNIPIYIKAIPDCGSGYRKTGHHYKFGELNDTHIYNDAQKYLAFGPLIHPIKDNIDKLSTYPDSSNIKINGKTLKETWETQATSLEEVRLIRNKSAHGENGVIVDIGTLNTLKEILFEQKRLIEIVQLSQYYHE